MGGTLLLADDSITIQKVVELTFAETDHTVVAVGSGRELLSRVGEVRPDVVLCDVVMPDMSGYEVCQTLKSGPDTLRIPVVLLTGTFEPFDRDRALASGCDAIVTKPFEARELISTVEGLLRGGPASAVGTPPPIEEASELPEVGVPEGVPSLDFTSSSLNRSGPAGAGVLAPPPDLPAVELTDTYVTAPPPAPPELSVPAAPPAGFGVPTAPPAAMPGEGEPLPDLDFRFDDQPAPAAVPTRAEPAPVAPAAVAEAPFAAEVGKTQKLNIGDLANLFSAKTQPPPSRPPDSGTTQPVLSAPFGAPPVPEPQPTVLDLPPLEPQPAPPIALPPAAEPPEVIAAPGPPSQLTAVFNAIISGAPAAAGAEPERPAAPPVEPPVVPPLPEPAVKAAPAPPSAAAEPAAGAGALSDADVDRIARRVLELATPLLEQIAWEVLPDVAETLVRARIAELEASAESET